MSSDEARAAETTTGVSQDERFALELEFVMSLANPRYIHHLAKEKFLDDPSFVAYLAYLQYWREPAYARFLHYPHALHFLGQLQRPEFRKAMANPRAVTSWSVMVNAMASVACERPARVTRSPA